MSKHLPVMLVGKLDNYLGRKHERLKRDSIVTGLSASFLLLSGIWQWTHMAGWPTVFMLVGAAILFLVSAWDFIAYKRTQARKGHDKELTGITEQQELSTNTSQHIPPSSVTEQTTRRLDSSKKR
ncbi:MAG TPA: hypothetical protein VE135_02115 [Pyrinomonadaceae bacterium]|nr:hypothetical protein [Pyrinomonadaceae bacterium]